MLHMCSRALGICESSYLRWADELLQMYTAEPAVPGIGDVATVHDLTKEGMQVFPQNLPGGTECIAEKKQVAS